ncbi:unnamed protein product [Heterobilharzia americana]|nr:unnamed protein product [Heterobilharzia americana]
MLQESIFSPSECLSILAAINDTSKQLEVLYNSNLSSIVYFPKNKKSNTSLCSHANRQHSSKSCDTHNLLNNQVFNLKDEKSKINYMEIIERLMNLFKSLVNELNTNGTVNCLEKYCYQQQQKLDELQTFINSIEKNEKYLNELQVDLQQLQISIQNNTIEFTTTLTSLKHELQELVEISNMIKQYKQNDYDMKLQKDLNVQSDEIKQLNDQLDKVKLQIQQQIRISEETNSWLYLYMAELENLSSYTIITYQSNDMINKMNDMLNKLEKNKAMHIELEQQYTEYEKILTEDNRQKEVKYIHDEYTKKFLTSILQIQSWWRTMIEVHGIKIGKRKGKKKKK